MLKALGANFFPLDYITRRIFLSHLSLFQGGGGFRGMEYFLQNQRRRGVGKERGGSFIFGWGVGGGARETGAMWQIDVLT